MKKHNVNSLYNPYIAFLGLNYKKDQIQNETIILYSVSSVQYIFHSKILSEVQAGTHVSY